MVSFLVLFPLFFLPKAYELSTLTGTQVMLLVASETGHVYTFATRKLQPMITSESGKALIQTCLNSPDPPVSQIPNPDQRMSATGYEETDLAYTVNENEAEKMQQVRLKIAKNYFSTVVYQTVLSFVCGFMRSYNRRDVQQNLILTIKN